MGCELESHLGLRFFLSPFMVDSLHLPLFLYHEQILLQKVGILYNSFSQHVTT